MLGIITPAYFPPADSDKWIRTVKSAEHCGMTVHPFGIGRQIDTHCMNAQGPDAIEEMGRMSTEYVMMVDAPDVLFLAGEQEIMEKFHSLGKKMIISAEENNFPPNMDIINAWKDLPGYDLYLNIGVLIGEREYVMYAMKLAMDTFNGKPSPGAAYNLDTMGPWMGQAMALGHLPDTDLDRHCVMFQSCAGGKIWRDSEWVEGRLHNKVTDTWPCVMHYNGDKSHGKYYEDYRRLYGAC